MRQDITTVKPEDKQRITAFIDPILVKRAKARGALEGLTLSEIVEKALDAYAPKIEKDKDHNVHLKFINGPSLATVIPTRVPIP